MASGSYWWRRAQRHGVLCGAAIVMVASAYFLTPPPDFRHRLSMGTAYAALAFFSASLWLGPWNVLRALPNPVSFDLRRDAGIWAGALALIHTSVGLTVHLRGRMWMYFLARLHPPALQNSSFGLANWTGAVASAVLLLLLAISNDASLRRLGIRRWKWLQRWTYLAFAMSVLHGALYQMIEKRDLAWVVCFGALAMGAAAIQAFGWIRRPR